MTIPSSVPLVHIVALMAVDEGASLLSPRQVLVFFVDELSTSNQAIYSCVECNVVSHYFCLRKLRKPSIAIANEKTP